MTPAAPPLLIDGHVHLHDCFDAGRFLAAAAGHFTRAAGALHLPPGTSGCLLLADCAGARGFERLREEPPPGWDVRLLADGLALRATHERLGSLLIMAGAQIRTAERLEVLGLITGARIPDGLPLEETVERVTAADGVAVVPWGFGKWTFGRRKRLERAMAAPAPRFALGDNGGRYDLGTPALFARAERQGILVLPGSDPLPYPDHEGRAGSCGFVRDVRVDEDEPAASLRSALAVLRGQPTVYCESPRLSSFVRDQLRMQLRKRPR